MLAISLLRIDPREESTYPYKDLRMNIRRSFLDNQHKLETVKRSSGEYA